SGIGVDISAAALDVARRNAASLGLASRVALSRGNWLDGIAGRFDVVISNPPYIPSEEIASLAPELAYDARAPLHSATDGLEARRKLARDLPRVLASDAFVALEIGAGQADAVSAILRAAQLEPQARRTDLSGQDRCLLARPAPH